MKFILRTGLILLIGACVFPPGNIPAQTGKSSTFQLTFFPPLGTNGRDAAQYTNTVSLNLLAGVSKNEEALTFGGLANLIGDNAAGVQFAGLLNAVGNNGEGVLFSGLLNAVGRYEGLQFAGLFNATREAMEGMQFAGFANTAKEMEGTQFAGVANIVEKKADGFQMAGFINVAKRVHGVQLAGFMNVAEESDTPIGFLNLIKNGEKSVGVTYNEIGSTIAAFRSGGKYTYGILGVGYNHKAKDDAFVTAAGLGAHIDCTPRFRINQELTGESIGNFSKEDTFRAGYTLLPAFRIGKHTELFGGPGIYYMQSDDMKNIDLFPDHSLWKKFGESKLQQVHIGYQFGLQYIF